MLESSELLHRTIIIVAKVKLCAAQMTAPIFYNRLLVFCLLMPVLVKSVQHPLRHLYQTDRHTVSRFQQYHTVWTEKALYHVIHGMSDQKVGDECTPDSSNATPAITCDFAH